MTNAMANKMLIPLLRRRAGRGLGRRLAVVEYRGRRSGQRHELVTLYSRSGRTLRIRVGMAEHKTWWRNFEEGHPLCLRLAGKDYDATARVVREDDLVSVIAELEDGPDPATGRPGQAPSEDAR
jgi:hypothetical protein